MDEPLKLVLIDDHSLCRKGLCELLDHRHGMQVVGTTGNADQAIALARDEHPDLVVMDLRMSPVDGLTLLQRMRDEGLDTPVLILTMSDSREDLGKSLRLGARGYLLKDMEPEEVADSIRRAARGELAIAPAMALKLAGLLDEEQQPAQASVLDRLTSRERQILDYVAQGMSNKAIARVLGISHDTVKLHVRHILSKLSLGSRVAAAVFAVEHRAAAGEDALERSRLRPLPAGTAATPALVPVRAPAQAAPADDAQSPAARTTPVVHAAGRLRQR